MEKMLILFLRLFVTQFQRSNDRSIPRWRNGSESIEEWSVSIHRQLQFQSVDCFLRNIQSLLCRDRSWWVMRSSSDQWPVRIVSIGSLVRFAITLNFDGRSDWLLWLELCSRSVRGVAKLWHWSFDFTGIGREWGGGRGWIDWVHHGWESFRWNQRCSSRRWRSRRRDRFLTVQF